MPKPIHRAVHVAQPFQKKLILAPFRLLLLYAIADLSSTKLPARAPVATPHESPTIAPVQIAATMAENLRNARHDTIAPGRRHRARTSATRPADPLLALGLCRDPALVGSFKGRTLCILHRVPLAATNVVLVSIVNVMPTRETQNKVIVRNVRLFDGVSSQTQDNVDVLIQGEKVAAISSSPISSSDGAVEIDGSGGFLMPGLSDAHVHLMGNANGMVDFLQGPTGALYGNTIAEAKRMLLRGFTSVRDMGGDTAPVKTLIDRGTFEGPRIFPSQAMISQTSGHADFAFVYDTPKAFGGRPSRTEDIHFTRVADGVPQVLAAVREQLRQGASQIKLTLGGGAASMYDPLSTLQYTPDEIRAAVQAATDYGTYVATHVYTPAGIARALDAGVRSIEHGHLADKATVRAIGEAGAWLSMQPFAEDDHHYPDPVRAAKNTEICHGTAQVYEWASQYGVKTAWGTDLLLEPALAPRQSAMAARLGGFYSNADALKMLTSGNAGLFELAAERNAYRGGKLGQLTPGSWADMILVDGDPLDDLSVIGAPDEYFKLIIKGGRIVKNELEPTPRCCGS